MTNMYAAKTIDEFFGEKWHWTIRQWKNVGLKFRVEEKGMLDEQYLIDCFEEDSERVTDNLANCLIYLSILVLKVGGHKDLRVMKKGVLCELCYDDIIEKIMRMQKYCRDDQGNLKENVKRRPVTHCRNCIVRWIKQLYWQITKKPKSSYAERTHKMAELTCYVAPLTMNVWVDTIQNNWRDNRRTTDYKELTKA